VSLGPACPAGEGSSKHVTLAHLTAQCIKKHGKNSGQDHSQAKGELWVQNRSRGLFQLAN